MPYLDHVVGPDSIRFKRSSVYGEAPAAGSLRPAEIAINTADGRMFVGGNGGAVIEAIKAPNQVVSSGDLDDLTESQQELVKIGTIVTTTDGRRWVYAGEGDKTDAASYIELADITPAWGSIPDKPTFADVATSGSYSDLADAPSLAAVATTGSYNDLTDTPTVDAVFSVGPVISAAEIGHGPNKKFQTLTLTGGTVTLAKGTGWPSEGFVGDVVLKVTVTSQTGITWSVVTDWFNQPPAGALAVGTHLFLLRGVGASIVEGHYIGNKR